ncbi:unnamed protein product [Allacma fusca]|uniref:Odorant receptor n=1 Tax=Allacma fusca TaxID=39272 RepID=A0A8J2PH47_9HEXA|nr:unnamed protein product [Allacma fusca]
MAKAFLIAVLLCMLFNIALQIGTYQSYQVIPCFIEMHFRFFSERADKFTIQTEPRESQMRIRDDICACLMLSLIGLILPLCVLQLLLSILQPQMPIYLGSLMDPKNLTIIYVLGFSFVFCYIFFTFMINCVLWSLVLLPYLFSLYKLLLQLWLGQKSYYTLDSLRSSPNFIHTWRCLEWIQKEFNHIFCPVVLLANKWIFIFLCVYNFIVVMKVGGIVAGVSILSALACAGELVIVFTFLGMINQTSQEVLGSWKTQPGTHLQKSIRSMRSLRIYVGTFYFADRGMVLTMLRAVLELTASILVTYH